MSVSKLIDSISFENVQEVIDLFPYGKWQVAGVAAGSFFAYKLAKFLKWWFIDPQLSPLKDLPGPDTSDGIFVGHFRKIAETFPSLVYGPWLDQYGHTLSYRGVLLRRVLLTKDPKAVAHILNHAYEFPKPNHIRSFLVTMFGEGLLFAEGGIHKRQRKILNPCFGLSQIRGITPIFYDKAFELRDIWLRQIEESRTDTQELDVFAWLTRATLDIIGLSGFDYAFDTLTQGETDELVRAFMEFFVPDSQSPPTVAFLVGMIPILGLIPSERMKSIARSRAVMARIGSKLVQEKRAAVLAAAKNAGEVEKDAVGGRDLLSVLIKANMATDVPESERMDDQEVIGQIYTLLIAGHETTSGSLTWLFYELAHPENQRVQTKLREELQSVSTDRPTMEELNALPYLDAVVRENLRLNSALDMTSRCAERDTTIPVSSPYVDKNGVERMEIRIGAGEEIAIPITLINRDKEIWGEDADEFKPERWLQGNTHPRSSEIAGVFSSILTFLGGPRACIGYRFALVEMKVLIFVLLRNISFELPEPRLDIERKSFIVTRPAVRQPDGNMKNTMPLRLKAVPLQ